MHTMVHDPMHMVQAETASRIAGSGMLLICYSELLVTSVHSDGSWWVCCLAGWSGSGPLPSAYGVTQLQEFDLGALPYAMDLVHCSRLQARRVHSTLGQIASARATSHIQYFSACCSPLIYFLFGKIWYESRTKSVLRHLGRPSQYYFGNSSFCPIFILPAVCMGCWISPWPPLHIAGYLPMITIPNHDRLSGRSTSATHSRTGVRFFHLSIRQNLGTVKGVNGSTCEIFLARKARENLRP